jgi:monoamine oxidase
MRQRPCIQEQFRRGNAGLWTTYGPELRALIGTLHWSGTETSPDWNGKMEGAVQSGERAAGEVLAAFKL